MENAKRKTKSDKSDSNETNNMAHALDLIKRSSFSDFERVMMIFTIRICENLDEILRVIKK